MYVIHFEQKTGKEGSGLHDPNVIKSDWIIPSSSDEALLLNVTTNSTLSTNMFYRATLFTAMDMMEAANFQFCKCSSVLWIWIVETTVHV